MEILGSEFLGILRSGSLGILGSEVLQNLGVWGPGILGSGNLKSENKAVLGPKVWKTGGRGIWGSTGADGVRVRGF